MRTLEPVTLDWPCEHMAAVKLGAVHRPERGCVDCLAIGGEWVHLRVCLTCGHVACCDSSPNRHATKHFEATRHPLMRQKNLQPLPRDGSRTPGPEQVKNVHAARRPNRMSRKRLRSLGMVIGTSSP